MIFDENDRGGLYDNSNTGSSSMKGGANNYHLPVNYA
jgi:hypothetical protein